MAKQLVYNCCNSTGQWRENAEAVDIATAIFGLPNADLSNATELRFGNKGSVSVVVRGPKTGCYFDHAEGRGGHLSQLIQPHLSVGSRVDRHLVRATAYGVSPGNVQQLNFERHSGSKKANHDLAMKLWSESVSLSGTVAEKYLRTRGLAALPDGIEKALRFHPAGPYARTHSPMLIGLYRDIHTNEPRGIHRTALSKSGEKIGRAYLGTKAGAAIKLSCDEDIAQGVVIGEGIETTLAAMSLGLCPAWAVGDAKSIGNFPVLPGVEGLTILVDHDASRTGQTQATKCCERWVNAGREVITVLPKKLGTDINDLLECAP